MKILDPLSRFDCLLFEKLLLRMPVINISQCNLATLIDDIVLVFFQVFDDLLIVNHFTDSNKGLVSHDRCLGVVEDGAKEERN